MPKANEIKRGAVLDFDGEAYLVRDVEVKSPSARGASTLYKLKLQQVRSQQNMERNLKGDDFVKEADVARRPVQFLFCSGNEYTFMDQEDYSQFVLTEADLGETVGYLVDGLEGIIATLVDGEPVGVQLPSSVALEIIETAPAIKGATAQARGKPAKLSTGLEVLVPEYLAAGEVIRVNTETHKYMSRA